MANRQAGRVQGGDATVIGAGIVGVCCALCLQHDGWRVTLLDPEPPGEACSFGNSGMLARGAIPPIAMPGVLWRVPGMLLNPLGPLAIRWSYLPRAAPWLLRFVRSSSKARVERITAELASLYRLVPDAYRPLVEAAGAEALYRSGGVLQLYESKEAFAAARWDFDLRRRHGAEMEMLGPEEIRQFEPALAPVFAGGVYRADIDYLRNPLRLTEMLAADFRRRGGEVVRARARGVEMGPSGPRRVLTEDGGRPTDLVVVAAGAWSRPLAAGLGTRLPLDTERGYHTMLPEPGIELRLPVKSAEGGFYLTPMELGLRVSGTVELGGLRAAPNWGRVEAMLRRVRRWLPDLNEAGGEPWMGFRPSMPDCKPVISPAPGQPGVFFAFGHGHMGLTLGAITGRSIADMVAGRETPVDMTPFSAARF